MLEPRRRAPAHGYLPLLFFVGSTMTQGVFGRGDGGAM
jgi:hypothetical protein